MAAITAVLATFDPEIIREATDPRTGIQTYEKFRAFMPNAGELKSFCDGMAARNARLEAYRNLPPAISRVKHEVPADPAPDHTGKHPAGTILSNFGEALRTYGVPKGAFDHDRWHPYGTGH